jgi:hypothetical protein
LLSAVGIVAVVGTILVTQGLHALHLLANAGGLFVLRAVRHWLKAPEY